ncbi:MAG: glycosyltransferase family 39 protein [Candidatus Sumerlaeia bacterium]|nr:glycosyltransferase family 39 protein [Candidatus Sumerlaeia bacterium]
MCRHCSPDQYRSLPWIIGLIVFVATWVAAFPTMPGAPGLTWDETYYHPAFEDTASWTRLLFADPASALSAEGIRAGWERINELPPVVKWLGAAAVSIPHGGGWWHLAMLRLFPALAFGLTAMLMYIITRRMIPGWWAILPTVIYLLHPRIWGHGQIAATETVFACVTVLTIWIALQDLNRWRWRIALVIILGIALATKVNGLILIAAVVTWLLLRGVMEGRRKWGRTRNDSLLTLAVTLLAPLVAFAIWPWMWHETGARLYGYYVFVREHSHQGLWYFGRPWNFNGPPAPVTYPLVISQLVTPVWILLLFWLAIVGGLSRFFAQRRIHSHRLLLVLALLAPFTASSLPGAPKYDGIRLFLPLFAPAALLIPLGLRDLLAWMRLTLGRGRPRRRLLLIGIPALLLLPLDGIRRPHIDFYNVITRVIATGERVFPFEQTYWLNAFDSRAINDVNRLYPPGSRIMTRGFHGDTLPMLQKWGVLNPELDVTGTPPLDAHIIHNRRGFWGNSDWIIWQERDPLLGWGSGPTGEPLIFLYDGRPPGSGPLPPGQTGFQ